MDGVIADFTKGWVDLYNADFAAQNGRTLTYAEVVTWTCLTDNTHFETDDQWWDWARALRPGVFRNLPAIDDAMWGMQELKDFGFDIVIITAKPDWAISDTFAWLSEHRVPTNEVHITKEKTAIACDAYIDDRQKNIEDFVNHCPDARTFRFVQPWNRSVAGSTAVFNWLDAIDVITEMEW